MKKANLLIHNIKQLLTVPSNCKTKDIVGKIGLITNGAIALNEGTIVWVGKSDEVKSHIDLDGEEIDAKNKVVCPAFIDAHTHVSGYPYGRANDFEIRVYGQEDYAGIARKGGGIRTTIECTQQKNKEELRKYAIQILNEFMRHGVGTIEAKSGYGMTKSDEIRQIELLQELNHSHPMSIVPTYLAHVLDPSLKREEYVTHIISEILPSIYTKVKSIDVFCDKIAFTIEETKKIVAAGQEKGLFASVHTDQTSPFQGAEALAVQSVTSLSHLENISEQGIAKMKKHNTIAILFPSCSFHLGCIFPSFEKLINANIRVALSTDWNPGSSPCSNILLVGYLAAKCMKMPLHEIMRSITINGASALHLEDKIGSLEVGKVGDICIFDIEDWRDLFTQCGNTPRITLLKKGVSQLEQLL